MPAAPSQAARDRGASGPAPNDSGQLGPVAPAWSHRPQACPHVPLCPPPQAPGRLAGRVIACHPEQGWSLLCNGVVIFDDTGVLLPDGSAIGPRLPGNPDLTQAGHVRTVAPIPPGPAPTTGLHRPGPVMAGAALARERADSWPG